VWRPEVVRWPAEGRRRHELAQAGIPRLLVITDDSTVPSDLAADEDWVRLPASEQDIAARLQHLGNRFANAVRLEGQVLQAMGGSVALTPREASLLAVLLEHRGRVAPLAALAEALGETSDADPRRLHDTVHRIRTHVRPLGLDVFSARGRGYALGLRVDESETC
jgi:DNA-binding response OmpR family regulator